MLVTSRYQTFAAALACLMLCLVTDTHADAAADVLARADAFLNNNTISQGFKVSINILRYNLGQLMLLMPQVFSMVTIGYFGKARTQSLTVDLI